MKITMIVNPSSGLQNSQDNLDYIFDTLSKHHTVSRFYTEKQYDAKNYASKAILDDDDLIIVSGGDGTVNEIANAVGQTEKSIPVAIYPGGTSNDFATYLNISGDADEFLELIENFNVKEFDLGQLNDLYFINVAAIGKLASVADEADDDAKARIGRLAYILNALNKLPDIFNSTSEIEIRSEEYSSNVDSLIILVSNTKRVGGFNNICPEADPRDGLFDVLVVKNSNVIDMAEVFLKILGGNHIGDENIIYFQTDKLYIDTEDTEMITNIDGENINEMPVSIVVHEKKFKVLTS